MKMIIGVARRNIRTSARLWATENNEGVATPSPSQALLALSSLFQRGWAADAWSECQTDGCAIRNKSIAIQSIQLQCRGEWRFARTSLKRKLSMADRNVAINARPEFVLFIIRVYYRFAGLWSFSCGPSSISFAPSPRGWLTMASACSCCYIGWANLYIP